MELCRVVLTRASLRFQFSGDINDAVRENVAPSSPRSLSFFPLHRAISTVEVIRSRGVQTHTHTHTPFRIARRRNKRNKRRGEGRRRDRMNLYRRRSSTRNTRSLNNESRFHFFSSLLPGFSSFFLTFFLLSLVWTNGFYACSGLPEGLDRETMMKTRSSRY